MAELHKVKSIGGGVYRITQKHTRKDINGNDVEMPCNRAELTKADIDERIAQYQARIVDANLHIQRLETVKVEIAKIEGL